MLSEHFHVQNTEELGLSGLTRGIEAAGSLLRYVRSTQPNVTHDHIQKPRLRSSQREMNLDSVTIRNLELIHPFTRELEGPTLYKVLNATITAMGGRLLKQWIIRPLVDLTMIHTRQAIVEELVNHLRVRVELRQFFHQILDLNDSIAVLPLELLADVMY